jgi:hypothetical protein
MNDFLKLISVKVLSVELVKRETKLSVKTKTKVSDQELQLLKLKGR